MNPLRAVREKCLDCTCQQPIEVRECTVKTCALYPFRMGVNPYRTKRTLTPEARAKATASLAMARLNKEGKL
jgi:hypothetical protein